jgi:hypothetical protein
MTISEVTSTNFELMLRREYHFITIDSKAKEEGAAGRGMINDHSSFIIHHHHFLTRLAVC